MDCFTGRPEVLRVERGSDVVDDAQVEGIAEELRNFLGCVLVSRIDHWQAKPNPQTWFRIGGEEKLRHFHHMSDGPPVGSTCEQNHVRAQVSNGLDAFMFTAAIVYRYDVHHDGSRAKSGALRAVCSHR